MSIENAFQGSLFSHDFLRESIVRMPDWQEIDDAALIALESALRAVFERFPIEQTPNESQTEDDLIWPVLTCLGWSASLRQQNLAARGRDDVPDGLLFADDAAKAQANRSPEEWRRYGFGIAVVESKRWLRPLDRRSGRRGEETAPSTQMLRYLRRVEDLTAGRLRWGILTNGARWRLYYQGARSVSEQFFEVDLSAILDLPGYNDGLFALGPEERRHWLKVFALVLRREAFLPTPSDARTFHQRALDEGRFYEQRVASNLSDLVFGEVFPELVRAIAAAAPEAPLDEVRQSALILLYRLLFLLYAEDRDLLPVREARYDEYGLRERVRGDVGRRMDRNDTFSETAARYWSVVQDLCRAIDQGDRAIGLPPYNGGLFAEDATPLLARIRIGDAVMARVIDALSFDSTAAGRKYINYRDLSVQQLGSIYERLLEHEIVRDGDGLAIRPNLFARKGSGSYYTPDDLVALILKETLDPLVESRMETFRARMAEAARLPEDRRIGMLALDDPAERLLDLKICDPAMGSGHFLVGIVDSLADRVITAMAEAQAAVEWGEYLSPLVERIERIRNTIRGHADRRGWSIDDAQLDDRHIIRRMVLKRCVYGVDKNPMAVELAKVALWLHTFTVGAPLSFLDHHLRCGDSLFGCWVRDGIDAATEHGLPLLLHEPITRATRAATSMQVIEGLTDAEIAEVHRSSDIFDEVRDMTAPLAALLSLIHAFDWLRLRGREDRAALHAFFDGQFGDPIDIATGRIEIVNGRPEAVRFASILERARTLVAEERFFHWQVAFPGVWSNWQSAQREGGFDAVVGNPPWDRMKLQQVEWFALRRPEIARAERASDRKRMIAALEASADPLAQDFAKASERAETASLLARKGGNYPLLSGGDTNLNSLFTERAAQLSKPGGMVGLLIPSGISTEMSAQKFFGALIDSGSIKCVYDFYNKRDNGELFFPDVYYRFKFCVFVFSPSGRFSEACRFASFVRNVDDLADTRKTFSMSMEHFKLVNPNSSTAPIYRNERDIVIVANLYSRMDILSRHASAKKLYPLNYMYMYHMTADSHLFRTREELEENEGAYQIKGNLFKSAKGLWVPLYEGKMVQSFDHRASGITTVEKNLYRSGQGVETSLEQHADPNFNVTPRYFVFCENVPLIQLAIKDITSTTNARSVIACMVPEVGAGHTLPLLHVAIDSLAERAAFQCFLCANLNSIILDFSARTKILSNHLSWYILEQLPVVHPDDYENVRFGPKTAAEVIRPAVLELTYTAHDMAPFARDLGYVDENGAVKPPFAWDEDRRLVLRAKLDAVFFHLYGVTDRDDVRYIYSTFPIVERQETAAYGRYRSRDLCLAWMNALAAGHPDADIA